VEPMTAKPPTKAPKKSPSSDSVSPAPSATKRCEACGKPMEGRGSFCVDCATAAGMAPVL
jgi:hypothetical protein